MAERSSFGFGERVLRVFPRRVGPGNGVGSSVRECLTTTNPMLSFVSCKTWTLTRQCSNRSALSTARCACWELHQIAPLCSKNENCSWSWRFLAARSMLGLRLPPVSEFCRKLGGLLFNKRSFGYAGTWVNAKQPSRTEDIVPIGVRPRSWPSKMLWSSEALPIPNVRDEPGGQEPC